MHQFPLNLICIVAASLVNEYHGHGHHGKVYVSKYPQHLRDILDHFRVLIVEVFLLVAYLQDFLGLLV
jgi:hypothetical protein